MSENGMIEVLVNGEPTRIGEPASLLMLIEQLDLPRQRSAIEHNLEIVSKTKWAETVLHDGDRLEIVHFVGGG